jgi:hypothetical protein
MGAFGFGLCWQARISRIYRGLKVANMGFWPTHSTLMGNHVLLFLNATDTIFAYSSFLSDITDNLDFNEEMT